MFTLCIHSRNSDQHAIQLAICPGPKYPRDYPSIIRVIASEFHDLSRHGLVVKKKGQEVWRGKIHLVNNIGDLPAMSSMAHHRSHTATYPCKICRTEGQARADGPIRTKAPSDYNAELRPKTDYTNPDPVSIYI